ncbi:autotransporter outer membrane beta-barrel domain-containing protein [Bradyrhizobium sp. USDA 377]
MFKLGLAGIILTGLATSTTQAQTYTWGGSFSTTTTSNYDLDTNWGPPTGAPPNSAGKSAIFSSMGSTIVSVTASPIITDSWTFDATSQNYDVSGQFVTFNGAGPNLINAGGTNTISNNMTGAGISVTGGSLELAGVNSFVTTSVLGGTFINSGSLASSVTSSATFTNSGILTGSVSNTGTFTNSFGATVTGALTQSAGSSSNSGTIQNGVALTGGSFTTTGSIANGLSSVSSTVNAAGTINGGITNLVSSVFTVTGSLSANGFFANGGSAQVAISGGNLTGVTSFTNNSISASAVSVSATRTLSATTVANNFGTFVNSGTVSTTGGTSNASGATFTNVGILNGGLNNGGTTNNSGTVNGGLTNSSLYSQTAGATNGGITNTNNVTASGGSFGGAIASNGSGSFNVTGGAVTANAGFTNNGTSELAVSGGSFTGLTALTNNSTSLNAVQVSAGAALSATSIANNAGTFTNNGTVTTTAGTTNGAGATFTTTGTLNGGLTNTGTVNAAGTINADIDHQSGSFTVTGPLTVNGTLTTGAASDLFVSGGNLNVTTLINQSNAMVHAIWIDAGRTVTATTFTNAGGNVDVAGTLNATNTILNDGALIIEATGTVNASVNSISRLIGLDGTINGNVTISNPSQLNSGGGSVTGRVTLATSGALVEITGVGATFGSVAGVAGSVLNTGAYTMTVGGDNSSSTFAGSLIGSGSFVKTGFGIMTLSGDGSAYTGTTTVNRGTLVVDGSIASSSLTTVNATGALAGIGTVGALQINAGGIFSPGGAGGPGTSMTVASLAMQSGALFSVFVDPATSSFANVTGIATLGGATVGAHFAAGSYVAKQYTILNASSITGQFDPVVANTGLPSGFHTTLSYDTNHAYLNLALNFAPPSGNLNGNQQTVGNAIINFFNANGTIPMAFGGLTPAGLTQLSGEVGSAPQQTTFSAMGQFLGLMTDPLVAGRGDPVGAGGTPTAYAEEGTAYAARNGGRGKSERDAYAAIYAKAAPIAPGFEQRWSVWAAGFGGSQSTDGNTVVGSNNTTSSLYGTAVGADYRISRDTLVGFALAGGGTNFTVANALGGGRSDLFQAGAFFRHIVGPAYITGAFAYGWQDIVTDRTVTAAGIDRLRAEFNANAWSGRLEGGYRFVAQGIGLTPYGAAQFTTFDLPAYAEQAIVGSNLFALAYAAKSVTDSRSELGLRSDKAFAQADGIVTLRGRVAWAHDFNPDRAIGATFQTLPGASFVVNGAAMASDSALVTAAAEKKWLNGWSAAASVEGEFSNVTRSYAGKGLVRYAW